MGVLLWAVFGYYWFLVVRRPITEQTQFALTIVGSIVVGVTLVMFGWVIYNMRLARGERRMRRTEIPAPPNSDFLGRTFVARNEDELKRASYVEVHLVEIRNREESSGHKVFRVADRIPSGNRQ